MNWEQPMLWNKSKAWLQYSPCVFHRPCSYESSDIHNHTATTTGSPSTKPPPNKGFQSERESDSVPAARSPNKGPSPSLAVFSNILKSQMAIGLIHRNLVWSPIMFPIFNFHSESSTGEEINTARQVGSESELQSHVFKSTLLTGCSLN